MLPIYAIMAADSKVSGFLLDSTATPPRLRLWGFGYADESQVGPAPVRKAYAIFQTADDAPENGLSCHRMTASILYQFDVYAPDGSTAAAISAALQSALLPYGFVDSVRHPSFEADVKLYRAGFDLSYISTEK